MIIQKKESILQTIKFNSNSLASIELVEKKLNDALSDSQGAVKDMCTHILNAGGKRVRPLLVLYSGLIFSDEIDELIYAATAAELIHMASLVHDDIIDDSSLRRNKPSINKIWGKHFAVLCGDYLFAKAFGILSKNRLIKSMDYMVEAIQNMCEGEILQAENRFNHCVTLDMYYRRIAKKTAIFMQCCCKSGAAVGGADELQVRMLGEYGLNLGLAFQIIDDILDFCGDVDAMGKPGGEDLRQGSITMPLIFLMQDDRYENWIKEILGERNITGHHIREITRKLKETGMIEKSFKTALSHIEKAKHSLGMLAESEYTGRLYKLADMLKARMN